MSARREDCPDCGREADTSAALAIVALAQVEPILATLASVLSRHGVTWHALKDWGITEENVTRALQAIEEWRTT